MARVEIDLSGAQRKLSPQSRQRGQYALANQALADMNPFVPMKKGILRMTGHVEDSGNSAVWNTPYAAEMFYMPKLNYTTPGTGPRWDNKAKGMYMRDWERAYMKGAGW